MAEFLVGVDEAEEDANVFEEGGADEVRGEDVEGEEGGVDDGPDDEPVVVDVGETFEVGEGFFEHTVNIIA